MLISTKGIVINTIKYGETSVIAKIFTPDKGLLAFIVNGVRKNKGRGALFNPLNMLDLVVYYKQGKNLLRLKEFKLNRVYQSIPFDIRKSSVSIFMLELLQNILKEEDENPELYTFLETAIVELDNSDYDKYFHLQYLLDIMAFAGIMPHGQYSETQPCFDMLEGRFLSVAQSSNQYLAGKTAQNLSDLMHKTGTGMDKNERKELLNHLIRYLQIHLEGVRDIKSIEVLSAVME